MGQQPSLVVARLAMLPFVVLLWGLTALAVYLILVTFKGSRALGLGTVVISATAMVILFTAQVGMYQHVLGSVRVLDDKLACGILIGQMFGPIGIILYAASKYQKGAPG